MSVLTIKYNKNISRKFIIFIIISFILPYLTKKIKIKTATLSKIKTHAENVKITKRKIKINLKK